MKEDWIETTIEEIKINSVIGLVRSSAEQNNLKEGIPYLKMNNIDMVGNLTLDDLVYVKVNKEEIKKYSLKSDDILINTRNSYELVGKAGIVNNISETIVYNNNIMRLRINNSIHSSFISYQLISPVVRKQMDMHKKATTSVCALYQRNIFPLKINIAPLPIQRAIVSKIETLFSDLDKGIADLNLAKAQLKIYRQAVLKKAFEGELTKKWREQRRKDAMLGVSETLPTAEELLAQIKEERQNHYEQQLETWKQAVKTWDENGKDGKKPSKPKNPNSDNLPKGWKWVKFEEIAEMCLGKMLDKRKNIGELKPYLGNINVRWGSFDLDNLKQMKIETKEEARYRIEKNDLIICEGGEPGRCAVWISEKVMYIQKALHRVRLHSHNHPFFFYYYLNFLAKTDGLSSYFTGTTIKHLTGRRLKEIIIPLPPAEEQHQIVREIESRLLVCDKVEESITEALNKSEALRQSILKKAFEGKLLNEAEIAQCKQEKDYEPASKLLERIKQYKK